MTSHRGAIKRCDKKCDLGNSPVPNLVPSFIIYLVLAGMQYYCTPCRQQLKPLLHRGGIIVKNMHRDCGYSKRAGLPRLYIGL